MWIENSRNKGIFAILLLAFFSVLMGVVARELSASFTLFQQIYLRLAVASLVGAIIFHKALGRKKLQKIPLIEWRLIIFRAILGFMIGAPLWVSGFTQAKLANAVFIDSIPMSSLLGFIVLKESVTFTKVFLLFLSFVGAAVISIKDVSGFGAVGKGEFLIFCAIVFFALRNVMRRFHSSHVSDAQITQLMHIIGALMLFMLSLFIGESLPLYGWTLKNILLVVTGGVLNVGILYTTNYGFSKLDAVTAGNLSLIAIVFGVILGSFLYAEFPTFKELFGGVLIVISVILMNRVTRKNTVTEPL